MLYFIYSLKQIQQQKKREIFENRKLRELEQYMLKYIRNFEKPDFNEEKVKLQEFLNSYEDPNMNADPQHGQLKYMLQMQSVSDRVTNVIEIHTEDLEEYFSGESEEPLVVNILHNTSRYIKLFADCIDQLLPIRNAGIPKELSAAGILMEHRQRNLENIDINQAEPENLIPPELLRNYEVYIVPGANAKPKREELRGIRAAHMGGLICVDGIVTRTSDIKPCVKVACYACNVCGYELYQTVPGRTFLPLFDCPSKDCTRNRTGGKLHSQVRNSKFTSYQEIKIQEPSEQVPVGHVPRLMTVIAKGEITRSCTPGDRVTIDGVLSPTPFNQMRNGPALLIQDMYIDAYRILRHKRSYVDTQLSEEMVNQIDKEKENSDTYSRLAKSIAPEIFGMEDVKKALLLLMIGGATKEMEDGMKIRGNINIMLMGDPGVAKSQLLKYIAHIAPRGVYTTGKGSSGVGLTAAVVKDPITMELSLEGGALVLADLGICCIDEFDKMLDSDRTNIHEVMEQQTVSIAKAGVTTSLNARASILAAANPLYGRYNRKITPHQNINLPAALLSRFDLIFLLLDKPDSMTDDLLAKHVSYVHKHSKPPQLDFQPLEPKFMRAFIGEASKIVPVIPQSLHNYIVQKYVAKRKEQHKQEKAGYLYITPRTLLGIIRIAQALARLQLHEEVHQNDVDEAIRLMDVSMTSVNEREQDDNFGGQKTDIISNIFNVIMTKCSEKPDRIANIIELENIVINKGFTVDQFNDTLNRYAGLQVIHINENRTTIMLI